jgi:chromate transporter
MAPPVSSTRIDFSGKRGLHGPREVSPTQPETSATQEGTPERKSALEIFLAFSQIAVSGFGGTGFWARLVLIERRRWLTYAEYVGCQSAAQLLPGPNVFNLAVIVGHRHGGVPGSLAALTGILLIPFLMMLGAGALYAQYGQLELVQRALRGISAVAVGLQLANALRLSTVLPKHWRPWIFVGLAFTAIGLARLPLIGVVAVLGPLSMLLAWRERK